jgi:uncharacterized damage-inducible protein DinB
MPVELEDAILGAFGTNNRINEYLVRNLPAEAWRARTPDGKGRTVADIVAHIHNVRLMWLKAVDKTVEVPAKLEGKDFTPDDAIAALEASWMALHDVLRRSLDTDRKVKGFKPDVASFFAYLVAHDAHHRGQITLLARLAGHPVSKSVNFGMWEWGVR